MNIKKQTEIILFPVAFAAGILTGIAVRYTGKKAARLAACEAAMKAEFPAADIGESSESVEQGVGKEC